MPQDNQLSGTVKNRRAKENSRREMLAKYLYDVSKLFIAGIFITVFQSVMSGTVTVQEIITGIATIIVAVFFAYIANRVLIY